MKPHRTFVLAGKYWEFRYWITANGLDPADYMFIGCPATIRNENLTARDVIVVGTWRDRADLPDILDIIAGGNGYESSALGEGFGKTARPDRFHQAAPRKPE